MALIVSLAVAKQLRTLSKPDRTRLLDLFESIAAAPAARHPGTTEMVRQPGVWRVRQGDWRAVYAIIEGDVVVARIAHRREVYQ